ncbi:hypothetical protein [Chelativorans sp. Marseille-P2723]|uniref:hypothetical protein n=1 Tax=Chelativorans sp. Marseille-P2723 TaxID=2709133 RepID=UPI00156E4007|nr:hypothetical protein [Chelativorans sp. Marseille-P2723]
MAMLPDVDPIDDRVKYACAKKGELIMDQSDKALLKRQMLTREQAAALVYHDLKESQRATFSVAAEYGRWLIASLILINGGALWSLFSYLGSIGLKVDGVEQYIAPIWSFIVGIALAMLSGLSAWFNWSLHSDNYQQMARYDMLWDPEQWTDDPPHTVALDFTYRFSIVAGVGSLIAGVLGGAFILHGNFFAGLMSG